MWSGKRLWARWIKAGLATLIVAGVGWQFARLLSTPELWDREWTLQPGWLVVSMVAYALGLGFWGAFWLRLLRRVGHAVTPIAGMKAYYVSHLGKYVPGKAWAILTRVSMLDGSVRPGVAALTATYETLTTMAAGALIAAATMPWVLPDQQSTGWQALGLLAIAGIPIMPRVFNVLIARIARPFVEPNEPLPHVPSLALPEGLAWAACGWAWLGLSAFAVIVALGIVPAHVGAGFAARCVAFNALSYVAGFLFLPAPGGLGVREALFQQFLARELVTWHPESIAGGLAVLAVVVLRLTWTSSDLVNAGVAYVWPAKGWLCSPS
ncbi:MAG: lysylphosphatidylglycerol synthase domain-containing protein [Gemmataceae bacterium]